MSPASHRKFQLSINCPNVEISCREVFGNAVYGSVIVCAHREWIWAAAGLGIFPSMRGTVGVRAPSSSLAVPLVLFAFFSICPV